MKNILKYVLCTLIVIALGIMYSCERAGNTIEINTSDNETTKVTEAALDTETASFDVEEKEVLICVHVTGCVNNPGVYNLSKGSRVFQAIDMAGGFAKDADREFLNLAAVLNDGQKIHVYSKKEAATAVTTYIGDTPSVTEKLLVNINTASKEQLMTLPGIGESRAVAIIAYREKNGGFKTIEDIMNISGIKEAAFSKIKDYICVK